MAKQDKETYESYAKDMFDNPPAGPMGVHRGARSMASRALPYVIVVIVALLAGLLFWGVYSGEISNLRMPWSAKEDSFPVLIRALFSAKIHNAVFSRSCDPEPSSG